MGGVTSATSGSPTYRSPSSQTKLTYIAIGAVLVACLVVGLAYVLALGPFERPSTAGVHGPASYAQAASVATSLADSKGGGPWSVWSSTAPRLNEPYNFTLGSFYYWPSFGCAADLGTYSGMNSSLTLPATPKDASPGYFSFWLVQLGNASGWVRTVVVTNGTPTIAIQIGPVSGCSSVPVLPTENQLGLLLDSPRIVASAWSANGSQFVSQHPTANLTLTLSGLIGPDTTWNWVVTWTTCHTAFGFQSIGGPGEVETVFVNALNGTAQSRSVQTVSC
jgi:hypothetical protein